MRFEVVNVTHPSTNRARCRITKLIETNALPLHQTTTVYLEYTDIILTINGAKDRLLAHDSSHWWRGTMVSSVDLNNEVN